MGGLDWCLWMDNGKKRFDRHVCSPDSFKYSPYPCPKPLRISYIYDTFGFPFNLFNPQSAIPNPKSRLCHPCCPLLPNLSWRNCFRYESRPGGQHLAGYEWRTYPFCFMAVAGQHGWLYKLQCTGFLGADIYSVLPSHNCLSSYNSCFCFLL